MWTYHNFHQGWWNSYLEIYFKIFLYIFMSALSMRTTFALRKKCFPWKKIQFLLALSGIRTPKLQEPSLCYLADFFEYYVILVSLHPLFASKNKEGKYLHSTTIMEQVNHQLISFISLVPRDLTLSKFEGDFPGR